MRNRDKETGNYKSMWPGQDGSFENSQAGWGGSRLGLGFLANRRFPKQRARVPTAETPIYKTGPAAALM